MERHMEKTEWLQFSEAENDAIALRALSAAHECIKSAKAYDGDTLAATRDVLSAFSAARAVIRDAVRVADEGAAPGSQYMNPYIEVHHVVATAMHFAGSELDLDVAHPYSMAGSLVLSFARACKALDAYCEVDQALSEDCMFGDGAADDVLKLFASAKPNPKVH
jgi:hypothetical protein